DEARKVAEAELEGISERVGGHAAFQAFAALVEKLDHEAKTVEQAAAAVKTAAQELKAARTASESLARTAATKRDALAASATALEQAAAGAERAAALALQLAARQDAAREAEAALATTKSELVDRLGDGDPRALLDERQHELELAETEVRAASAAADAAR